MSGELSGERVACQTAGCANTILPATAARTGGICRPCEQRIAGEEHEAFVRANRREVDIFTGVTDPVEIARLLVRPKVHDELVVEKPFPGDVGEFFRALAPRDVERIMDLAISWEEVEQGEELALWLAVFTDADLGRLQAAWVEEGRVDPGIVFRGAAAEVRDRVVRLAKSRDVRDPARVALAWIGGDTVTELFARWRPRPEIAWSAGWELDASKRRRRDLYRHTAFALIKADSDAPSPVRVPTPASGTCPRCTAPLLTLFEFDLEDPRLAPLALPPQVVTCAGCCCYRPIFMQLTPSGAAQWHDRNDKTTDLDPEDGEMLRPTARLVLGNARGPLHAALAFPPTTVSQVGGAPGWLQNPEYPSCPGCGTTMPFIAQVTPEELMESPQEGTYYAFWCDRCQVTATAYQQT